MDSPLPRLISVIIKNGRHKTHCLSGLVQIYIYVVEEAVIFGFGGGVVVHQSDHPFPRVICVIMEK